MPDSTLEKRGRRNERLTSECIHYSACAGGVGGRSEWYDVDECRRGGWSARRARELRRGASPRLSAGHVASDVTVFLSASVLSSVARISTSALVPVNIHKLDCV